MTLDAPSLPMPAITKSGRTATASMIVEAPLDRTRALAERALSLVGSLRPGAPGEVHGVIARQWALRARVRVVFSEPQAGAAGETLMTVETRALDLTGSLQRHTMRRFFDTFMRQSDPAFVPNRWGDPPWVTVVWVGVFVGIAVLCAFVVNPAIEKWFR